MNKRPDKIVGILSRAYDMNNRETMSELERDVRSMLDLGRLDQREYDVLGQRLGFSGYETGEKPTYRALGEFSEPKVTLERVRQIATIAAEKVARWKSNYTEFLASYPSISHIDEAQIPIGCVRLSKDLRSVLYKKNITTVDEFFRQYEGLYRQKGLRNSLEEAKARLDELGLQPKPKIAPEPEGKDPNQIAIADLNISLRTYHFLQREGIGVMAQLLEKSESELMEALMHYQEEKEFCEK